MTRSARFALAGLVFVAACGGSSTDTTDAGATTTAPPPAAATTTTPDAPATTDAGGPTVVSITGFAFAPQAITVPVGTTVRWTNDDPVPHTTTSADAGWDQTLAGGEVFEFTFEAAGDYPYLCTIHPSMTATVTVEG